MGFWEFSAEDLGSKLIQDKGLWVLWGIIRSVWKYVVVGTSDLLFWMHVSRFAKLVRKLPCVEEGTQLVGMCLLCGIR